MSKQKEWLESIRRLPAFVQGAIGLFTLIIGFVVLFRDNVYLSITVSVALILIATFLLCIYLVFAKTPPLVEGGRGVYRFEGYRIWALVGIFFVPILVTVLLLTGSSRSFVIIAFAGTATPTSSPTMTAVPPPSATLTPSSMMTKISSPSVTLMPSPTMTAVPHPLITTTPSLTTTPSSNGFVIAVSDFAGDPKLGSEIADEIEEALLSKIRKDRLNVGVLEGVIETQIDGVTEAEEIAGRNSIDLIVWGKLIDYGNNNVKVIPKIYIANPIEDLQLRGRTLDIKIINPSDISLREQSAIDLAQFTALVLGVLDFNQGKYDQAIEVFGSVTGKYEAEANFYLGLCYYLIDSSLWDRAIDNIRNAVELYPDFGIAHVNLGMIYFDVGFVHQAYYSFVKAEDIGSIEGDIELLSAASSGLGLYYMYEGDYEKAEAYFQSSLEGYEKLNIEESVANQYGNLALAKLEHHELNEAKRLLEKALAIHRRLKDWLGEANDLSNLGLIHRQLGDYSKALEYQNAALDIYENHGYTKGIIRGLRNVGINYLYQKDYPSAEAFFEEQLRILEETGDLSGKAEVLSILGEIQLSHQEPSSAKAYFEEALAIYLEIGNRAEEAELLYSLALVHTRLGETERAIDYLQMSYTIYRELGDPKAEIATLLNLVGVYMSIQNYEESIDVLHRALEISKQTDDYLLTGRIYAHLGEAYEGKKDFNAAIQNYNEALRIFQETGQQEMAEITLESIERVSNKRKNSD